MNIILSITLFSAVIAFVIYEEHKRYKRRRHWGVKFHDHSRHNKRD